ncbi:cytochrome b-245 heavy chain-like [Lineus longissimus]|uniref:cytochrome b-245 heavy chain-like n=1 Tax=Lineus longissimus TaxID=88925 RepID=UPI002B4D64EA
MGWFVNEFPKWAFLFLYHATNIGLFIGYFMKYYQQDQYYYLRALVGLGLPFARGAAACLNFNCALILLPVCRNLITFVRGSCLCCKRNMRRQLDKNITFHKTVAYMICLHTAIHAGAHCFNVQNLALAWNHPDNNTAALLSTLSSLPSRANETFINFIRIPNAEPTLEVLKVVPGVSGVIITLSLILIVTSATEVIRRSYFEVFWYTHHLFIVFFIGCIIHGVQGVIRGQTNLKEHDPHNCSSQFREWGRATGCPNPQFGSGGAQTWMWVIGPFVIYLIERILRMYRSFQEVIITKVVKHPSRVIELQLKKKGFRMESGQYIFLKCPSISHFEWHPFTLTSSPQEDFFSVHIRLVGDWTEALAKACIGNEKEIRPTSQLPKLAVDGPFGTASEDVYEYQVDVLVGAGIGVTPFASLLKDMWYKYCDPGFEMKVQKVYFYWICPDTSAFEWFSDLLSSMEQKMAEQGKTGFFESHIFLTRGWDPNQARNIVLHEDDDEDAITGLQQKTQYGRPQWDTIFPAIAQANPEKRIGVFCCGPKTLSSQLHKLCNIHSDPSRYANGTHFYFNKENF